MAEEAENSGGGSLKSILIGLASTIALGVGGYVTKQLTGEGDEPAQATATPAPVINITQNQAQQQAASGGKTVIIKEKAVPGAAQPQAAPAPKPKKKEGDEFKEEKPQW
jgi:Flp pilus assembly protein TadD